MNASINSHPGSPRSRGAAVALVALCVIVAATLLGGVAGCGSRTPANEVVVKDLRFTPNSLTVTKGTTVTWKNEDQTAHTITSDSNDTTDAPEAQKFTSEPLNPGDTYKHKFDTPGTYKYHCSIHPYLTGEVVVK